MRIVLIAAIASFLPSLEAPSMAQPAAIDAIIVDMSLPADFSVTRDGVPLPPKLDRSAWLGSLLSADDVVVVRSGWLEIAGRYSGNEVRLGPVLDGEEPLSVVIQRDRVPSAFSGLRDALTSLVDLLSPPEPQPTEVMLVTKGAERVPRSVFFPPVRAIAGQGDRLVVGPVDDLLQPVLLLEWGEGRRFETPVFAVPNGTAFEVPFSFGQLADGTPVEIQWRLSDEMTGLDVAGTVQVQPSPSAQSGQLPADPVLAIASAWGEGRVFQARRLAAELNPNELGLVHSVLSKRLVLE
ncbi:MAG: hypothetical protein AAF416_11150 [Pseudomonadota bacterium]